MIIRSGEPCKYDQSPYGTVCKRVKPLNEKFEIYVQMSKNENYPQWEKVGIFSQSSEHTIASEVERVLSIKKHTKH